jgi:hypothetical protein
MGSLLYQREEDLERLMPTSIVRGAAEAALASGHFPQPVEQAASFIRLALKERRRRQPRRPT